MATLRKPLALALSLLMLAATAPRAAAADHVASAADIQSALRQQTQADQQRATILGLLQRSEMRELMGRAGLELRSAESAVRTLAGEELTRVADYASQAEKELAGGAQTITISVVTLLLIIIIIILLVD